MAESNLSKRPNYFEDPNTRNSFTLTDFENMGIKQRKPFDVRFFVVIISELKLALLGSGAIQKNL